MVYDLEVQTKTYMKRKASPFCEENYIVAAGWKKQGDKQASFDYMDEPNDYMLHIPDDVHMLVGFNIKFDLLWQWDNPALKAFFKRGGVIWDCQYAEYLLQGQNPKYHYPDLGTVACMYGGTKKIDEVKILWGQGVNTSEIPKDLLIDYLVGTLEEKRNGGDIGNTERVFLGQVKKAKELGMTQALKSRMDGLCATTEMEWNGLKIDVEEAKKQLGKLKERRKAASKILQESVPKLPDGLEFNWGSRTHKSCLVFGGTVKYKKKSTYIDPKTGELARAVSTEKHYLLEDGSTSAGPTYWSKVQVFKGGKRRGEYKTKNVRVPGELKTKYCDFYFKFPGYVQGRPEWETESKDAHGQPLYSTSSETIMSLENSGVPFCKALCEYEAVEKEITTYFVSRDKSGDLTGMLTCVQPHDHLVHHSLNHCATVTSRLSSSNPNGQNFPRGDKSNLKKVFISRYEGGQMIESDYSQLEIVVQAVLSADPKLIKDLLEGIDFHCKRVAMQPSHNITYDEVRAIIKDENHPDHAKWKKVRTLAKIFAFQRAYGAGAILIAASTGMALDDVKELITAEEKEYKGIVDFNKAVEEVVLEAAVLFKDYSDGGKTFRRSYWTSPTGCRYHFRSYPAQDWQRERGIQESFSPTEMKNYPVQGTGGEIVQGICGRLWRHFVANDNYDGKAVLCNTVHDCVWADAHPDVALTVAKDIKRIMESVPEWFQQFGLESPVPFPVEVEMGPNMLELKHVA